MTRSTLTLAALAALAGCADHGAGGPAPKATAGVFACAPSAVERDSLPAASDHPLVPPHPVDALLCDYGIRSDDPAGSAARLTGSRKPAVSAESTAKMINTLPAKSGEGRICSQVLGPFFQIVFSYKDGKTATVAVSPQCGTVSRDRHVRDLGDYHTFMANWAS